MNIVVFETETWAQTAWQRMKDHHEVRLLEEFLTPHCAFFTREAVRRILDVTMANVEAFVRGEPQNVFVPL